MVVGGGGAKFGRERGGFSYHHVEGGLAEKTILKEALNLGMPVRGDGERGKLALQKKKKRNE